MNTSLNTEESQKQTRSVFSVTANKLNLERYFGAPCDSAWTPRLRLVSKDKTFETNHVVKSFTNESDARDFYNELRVNKCHPLKDWI